MPQKQDVVTLALEYARRGVKVFSCRNKQPLGPWRQNASCDALDVEGMFLDPDATTIGLPCGENDLLVLDLDVPGPSHPNAPNGIEAFMGLGLSFEFGAAPQVRTPSGGLHIFFRQPRDGRRFTNGRGKLPAGIDVRGDGGFVVGVGSVSEAGRYKQVSGPDLLVSISNDTLPELPDALARLLEAPSPKLMTPAGDPPAPAIRWTKELLKRALDAIPNNQAFDDRELWVRMGRHIFAASQGAEWGRELWTEWSDQQPQKPGEVDRVWDSFSLGDTRAQGGRILADLERMGEWAVRDGIKAGAAAGVFGSAGDAAQIDLSAFGGSGGVSAPAGMVISYDGDPLPPPMPRLVEDLFPEGGLSMLAGQSGAGKSFAAVALCVALGDGREFLGLKTTEGSGEQVATIYVAAEAGGTIPRRILACKAGLGITRDLPIAVAKRCPDLSTPLGRRETVKELRGVKGVLEGKGFRLGLVVIDTMAAAFGVRDENQAGEMAMVMRWSREIGDALGAGVLLVHHHGKDAGAGARGSSAITAAVDTLVGMYVERDAGVVSARWMVHEKDREGETGRRWDVDIQSQQVGTKTDGSPWRVGWLTELTPQALAARDARSASLDTIVLRAVLDNPGIDTTQMTRIIFGTTDADRSKAKRVLSRLVDHKLIKVMRGDDKKPLYMVTEEGKSRLEKDTLSTQKAASEVF